MRLHTCGCTLEAGIVESQHKPHQAWEKKTGDCGTIVVCIYIIFTWPRVDVKPRVFCT